MAVLGLHFCARAFSSCGERGPLFITVRGHLTVAASLVAEHRLQTRRLSSCGSRAQLLRGMWDLPRPGLEPMSPVLAGRFSTTAPPGKPRHMYLFKEHKRNYIILKVNIYPLYSIFHYKKNLPSEILHIYQKVAKILQTGLVHLLPSWLHLIYNIKTRKLTLVECMHIVPCHFITCVDSCTHYHNQDTDLFHHYSNLPHTISVHHP